jgi:hypothetical protein
VAQAKIKSKRPVRLGLQRRKKIFADIVRSFKKKIPFLEVKNNHLLHLSGNRTKDIFSVTSLPTGPLPTGRQAVPTVGGAGRCELERSLQRPAFRGIQSEALHHVGCRASGQEILTILGLFQKS